MLRIQAMYFNSIRCYASYCGMINTGVSPGKMCSHRRKNHGCRQKKQKALALLGLASGPLPNAVNSSVVPTEFTAEPTPGRQIGNLNSSPSTKKTTEFSFELFLSINKMVFFLNFVDSATRVTMRFRAKTAGYSTELSQVCATSYW